MFPNVSQCFPMFPINMATFHKSSTFRHRENLYSILYFFIHITSPIGSQSPVAPVAVDDICGFVLLSGAENAETLAAGSSADTLEAAATLGISVSRLENCGCWAPLMADYIKIYVKLLN